MQSDSLKKLIRVQKILRRETEEREKIVCLYDKIKDHEFIDRHDWEFIISIMKYLAEDSTAVLSKIDKLVLNRLWRKYRRQPKG